MTGQHFRHVDPSLLTTNVPAVFNGGNVIRHVREPATLPDTFHDGAYSTTRPRTLARIALLGRALLPAQPSPCGREATSSSAGLLVTPGSRKVLDARKHILSVPWSCTSPGGLQTTVSPDRRLLLVLSPRCESSCRTDSPLTYSPASHISRPGHLTTVDARCGAQPTPPCLLVVPSHISPRRSAKLGASPFAGCTHLLRFPGHLTTQDAVPSRCPPRCARFRPFASVSGAPAHPGERERVDMAGSTSR